MQKLYATVIAGHVAQCRETLLSIQRSDITQRAAVPLPSPLMVACLHGNTAVVRCLLEEAHTCSGLAASNAQFAVNGWTPLMYAIAATHLESAAASELIELLLRSGCDASLRNWAGMSAADVATSIGNAAALECLIDHGQCSPSLRKDLYGASAKGAAAVHPIFRAIEANDTIKLLELVVTDRSCTEATNTPYSALTTTSRSRFAGDLSTSSSLSSAGLSPSLMSSTRGSSAAPLFHAVRKGNLAMVKLLVGTAKCRFLDVYDEEGFTPLSRAVFLGHRDIAVYLAAMGADLNAQTGPLQNGYSPIELVQMSGSKELYSALASVSGAGSLLSTSVSGSTRAPSPSASTSSSSWLRIARRTPAFSMSASMPHATPASPPLPLLRRLSLSFSKAVSRQSPRSAATTPPSPPSPLRKSTADILRSLQSVD